MAVSKGRASAFPCGRGKVVRGSCPREIKARDIVCLLYIRTVHRASSIMVLTRCKRRCVLNMSIIYDVNLDSLKSSRKKI